MFQGKIYILNLVVIVFVFIIFPKNIQCSLQGEEVSKWADSLGVELWKLGQTITKYSEIKKTYSFLNAQVGQKDPRLLLAEIKENILRMMDRKMDAIRCIQQEAENRSEIFEFNSTGSMYQYYSSKYSPIIGIKTESKLPKPIKKNKAMYLSMKLNNDTHFYNLAVNTTHSSVHVPTNVYDRQDDVSFAIQWSEVLDDVFARNYNSDPALSWQYFGSSSGIMRHYPAKRWEELKKDLFDCRIRTWFIEAATCTKDVIILFDNSGSMDGMGKHIGALTAYSILDTFSNNDYVNVFNYSLTTNYTVPCFENLLVQATRENVRVFKEAISRLEPSGKTKLSQALETAFDLLSMYREKRGCAEDKSMCNQAIMIISDGIAGNLSDTINKYIDLYNGSNIPRLFTYLIGKEVTNVAEIKWVACANRGYYTHVQSLEQVTASVLKYINVVARPLVLQGKEHPVSWTHAYADLTYDDANDNTINEPYRLLTSAAIPCFDRKVNKQNDTRTADLLGVAATDVPIDEFRKLTLPYKIGVNAYAFIVSNNGYVLMHPDLRPVFEGILKENYNSIDLTEVEQHDDDLPSREIGDILQELRSALVNGSEGSIHNVTLKYHYNDVKRVSQEAYDYYFTPLEETPFSIAIAIPNKYGNFSLNVGDEIQKNRHTGQNLTDFFFGKWKIHPKWVYCRYHYLEGHEFKTPEKELLHFLKKMYDRDFKWERQYEAEYVASEFGIEKADLAKVECGRKTHGDDDYYCDKQLVQRMIFDARNTKRAFEEKFTSEKELALFKKFNATLRFVATMSGLTRWDYIFEDVLNNTKKEFGDFHARAIDETWYKSAVIQHQYDTESFVYSVPFDAGVKDDNLVTGSYAIFPTDAGVEAPGSVVGFQFSQAKLKARVQELSTKLSNQCLHCGKCDTSLDCYVVDSSGYIVVSENNNDTGRFFGEIEGDIMDSMLKEKIYKEITLFDYQALCRYDEDGDGSSATSLYTPLGYIKMAINWMALKLFWLTMEVNFYNLWQPQLVFAQEDEEGVTVQTETEETIENGDEGDDGDKNDDNDDDDDDDDDDYEEEVSFENDANLYYACEKEIHLYILEQHLISDNFHGEIIKPETRPYYVKKIPYSNLIFVAVNSTMPVTNTVKYTITAKKISKAPVWEIDYLNTTLLPCQKLNLNSLPRRRLQGCFNEHPLESEIRTCGRSSVIKYNLWFSIVTVFLSVFCI